MSDNSLLLKDLGYRLKREREQKGLSVDQVIQLTRISRTNIAAIEDGNLDDLPHTVYAKGFIRSYAEFLGVPSAEVDEVLEQVIDNDPAAKNTYSNAVKTAPTGDPLKGRRIREKSSKKSSLPTILLVLVLLGVLGWLVWTMQGKPDLFTPAQKEKAEAILEKEAESIPDQSLAEERFADEQAVEAEMDRQTPGTYAEKAADAEASTSEDSARPDHEADSAVEAPRSEDDAARQTEQAEAAGDTVAEHDAAGSDSPAAASETAPQEIAAPSPYKKNSVMVTAGASDSCWMEVRSDGGSIKEYFIQRGQVARFAYNESLWIRLGNAGGVSLKHNGKSYPLNSQKGQVKTIIFP